MNSKLSEELVKVQSKCRGLFKHPLSNQVELVIEIDKTGFTTIAIGNLLGLQTSYFGNEYLNYVILFPDDKSLTVMMDTPFAFSKWYNERFK